MLDVDVKWDDLVSPSCQQPWRQQFISDKITTRICIQPRTETSNRSKHSVSESRKSFDLEPQVKCTGYLRLDGVQLDGWDRLCYMTERIKRSKAKVRVFFFLILSFVLEILMNIFISIRHWKTPKLDGSWIPRTIKNWMENDGELVEYAQKNRRVWTCHAWFENNLERRMWSWSALTQNLFSFGIYHSFNSVGWHQNRKR